MRARSIADLLSAPLLDSPSHVAVVGRSGHITYSQLEAAVARTAGALRELGVGRGDVVAVSLPNDVDIVVAFHAVVRLGAIWVGINRNLAPPEQQFIISDSGASTYLVDESDATSSTVSSDQLVPISAGDIVWGRAPWDAGTSVGLDAVESDALAPAALAYTSGTTGRPKGVIHSQHNMVVPGEVLVATRHYGPELRKGDCLPLTILNLVVLSTLLTSQAR